VKVAKSHIYSIIAIMCFVLLAGCATTPDDEGGGRHRVYETKRLLSSAGFEVKTAQSSEELKYLNSLAQWTIVPKVQGDSIRYEYADAAYCQCLYVGTGAAYQRYLRLLKEEKQTRRKEQAQKWYGVVNR
jgi:hypothetical protein